MVRAFAWVSVAYAVAGGVAVAVGLGMGEAHPIAVALAADVAATLAVFGFSVAFRNSSFYDPYWSVAPIAIGAYWIASSSGPGAGIARQALAFALVSLWGVRLTYNWARGWQGLQHEDWRYVDLQSAWGRAYWVVSFVGIHMLPTGIVFVGCLSLYPTLADASRPVGLLDGVAAAVVLAAILVEGGADNQLRRFRMSQPPADTVLNTGLWAWSRHPNYFGEMLFWFGLWLLALAASPAYWWTIAGPVTMVAMFRFVSLPMIENRMRARRPGFASVAARTPLVIPRPPR